MFRTSGDNWNESNVLPKATCDSTPDPEVCSGKSFFSLLNIKSARQKADSANTGKVWKYREEINWQQWLFWLKVCIGQVRSALMLGEESRA